MSGASLSRAVLPDPHACTASARLTGACPPAKRQSLDDPILSRQRPLPLEARTSSSRRYRNLFLGARRHGALSPTARRRRKVLPADEPIDGNGIS